ncbi:hypothetical protein [Janibacter cremeus]|uniref:Na+/H+ antiporter NhaD/arsenite permease-like protein n=1 Tax=Janibacter cremeus TaxID=1285192 RepID=A0A852VMT7_9MICO|nr:hypothetical protein [Janibacter cremeus]NYF98332.1 Na+/H+ antiporter NhaD/arsenite permease-like protein [Janibacter cremeus]
MDTLTPPREPGTTTSLLDELRTWQARRWWTAAGVAVLTMIVTAVPTAMVPTPIFSRDVPTTAWAWPVLTLTSVLAGMVTATYVARRDPDEGGQRGSRLGMVGAFATFFAVGCPVCNKLVLLALGYAGALQYFAPVQPLIAATAIGVLLWALVVRVRRERACRV